MRRVSHLDYLFLDLNSYFAAVEQQDDPRLRGRPVAVVPVASRTTCAIAASVEAKRYGIRTGTRIYDALRMCPDLICVKARPEVYVDYHHRIMEELASHLPIEKVWSIDEASCRLGRDQRDPEAARALALRIKAGMARNVGEHLTCSIGLAPTSLLAKIATEIVKPDGLVILDPQDLPGRLLDLSLRDLPGIGENMERRLNAAGIMTVEDLWNLDADKARKVWGGVTGPRFWYALKGYAVSPPETRRRTLGHSRVLAPEQRPVPQARIVSRALLLKAARRLRRHGLAASGLAFSLDLRGFKNPRWGGGAAKPGRWDQEFRFETTQDSFTMLDCLEDAWARFIAETGSHAQIRLASVTLLDLAPVAAREADLFDAIDRTRVVRRSRETLWRGLDRLDARYGRGAVVLASQMEAKNLEYLGAKIAFGRIPERAEFRE